ncbi:DUF4342 domain-containing protein [Devosia sp.]|uniref:DUF4342 domain-containing protein n=1 Tax=Devosia sp. TaxID=1871048 RepID=UPI0032638C02
MTEDPKTAWKTFTEEIEVTGHQLVEQVTRLVAEGNVRQLQIRSEKGDVYLTVPLTAGAIVGSVAAIAAPWLAVIGAIAGLVAKVRIVIVRETPPVENETAPDGGEAPSGD